LGKLAAITFFTNENQYFFHALAPPPKIFFERWAIRLNADKITRLKLNCHGSEFQRRLRTPQSLAIQCGFTHGSGFSLSSNSDALSNLRTLGWVHSRKKVFNKMVATPKR